MLRTRPGGPGHRMSDEQASWPGGADETLVDVMHALGIDPDADLVAIADRMRTVTGSESSLDAQEGGRLWLRLLRGLAVHVTAYRGETYDSAEVNMTVMIHTGLWGGPEAQQRWSAELGSDEPDAPSVVLLYDVLPRLVVAGVLELRGHKTDERVAQLQATGSLPPFRRLRDSPHE